MNYLLAKLLGKKQNNGFTLIEMMVVIAVVAVLVSIIVPVVTASTQKAKAATDAANLREVLGEANALTYTQDKEAALKSITAREIHSKLITDAEMYLIYNYPGFVSVMFLDSEPDAEGTKYYSLEYFAEVAEKGKTERTTDKPELPYANLEWIKIAED